MNWLYQAIAVCLLAAWMPANSHCLLEAAGLIPTDDCCADNAASSEPHQTSACDPGDTLASMGSRTEDHQPALPLLRPDWLAFSIDFNVVPLPPPPDSLSGLCLAPPGLPNAWQFRYRTAWPPRAPSLVS